MKHWKKYSREKLIKRIDEALESTIDFQSSKYLGYPVSKLDENVFNTNGNFLSESPSAEHKIALTRLNSKALWEIYLKISTKKYHLTLKFACL